MHAENRLIYDLLSCVDWASAKIACSRRPNWRLNARMPNMSNERAMCRRSCPRTGSQQRNGTPDLLVLDIRSAVDGGGRAAFEQAHIPGAIHTDYAKDGWRAVKGMATGLLPDIAALKTLFARFGLLPSDHVVIVSAGTSAGDFCAAARVYWTLKIAGHAKMSILDGGMLAWQADPARPLEAGAARPRKRAGLSGDTRAEPPLRCRRGRARNRERRRCSARHAAPRRFSKASSKSPQALRAGRLPGAMHLDNVLVFDDAAKRLKPLAELQALFAKCHGQAGGQLLQYRTSGRDHLVRAVGNPAAAGNAL